MGTGLTNTIVGAPAIGAAVATGDPKYLGIIAAKIGYEKFGQQSMARSANAIANILEASPEAFGKYAPAMLGALQKGGQSLAVQHYIMSQKDPQYVETVKQALEEGEKKKIELPEYGGLGADIGNMIDNVTWSDKTGLDPQEQEQSGFQYGEGLPSPAMSVNLARRRKFSRPKPEYKGGHTAPTRLDDVAKPIFDLKNVYPDDIYSSAATRLYGHGEPFDIDSVKILQSVKNNPDAEVIVYRAMPKAAGMRREINPGDWVTPSLQYAKDHGENALNGSYVIKRKRAKAKDLFTDGNSIHEWGYDPE